MSPRPRITRSQTLLAAWTVGLLGCGSSSGPQGGGVTAPGDTGAASSDSGFDARPGFDAGVDTREADCVEDPADRPVGSVCVHAVRGSLIDSDGSPLKATTVSVCGSVCFFGRTGDDGKFDNHVGRYIVPSRFQILVHGRPDHVSLYVKLPAPGADGYIDLPTAFSVPRYDVVGAPLPADGSPSQTVTAGDVTLKTPAGGDFDLDPEDVASGDAGRLLRYAKWAAPAPPDFVAGSDFAALYAMAPFGSRVCASPPCSIGATMKYGVSLKNTTALAAGSAVEFFILGTDLYTSPPTAGRLIVQATGKVSADGKTIDTDPGQGIEQLTFLGVRAKK